MRLKRTHKKEKKKKVICKRKDITEKKLQKKKRKGLQLMSQLLRSPTPWSYSPRIRQLNTSSLVKNESKSIIDVETSYFFYFTVVTTTQTVSRDIEYLHLCQFTGDPLPILFIPKSNHRHVTLTKETVSFNLLTIEPTKSDCKIKGEKKMSLDR